MELQSCFVFTLDKRSEMVKLIYNTQWFILFVGMLLGSFLWVSMRNGNAGTTIDQAELNLLKSFVHQSHQGVHSIESGAVHEENSDLEYPPCGEICSYTEKILPSAQSIPKLQKNINCRNIMKRMAYKGHKIVHPPPEHPPQELVNEFSQNGECPFIEDWYLVAFSPNQSDTITIPETEINDYINKSRHGINTNGYHTNGCMMNPLNNNKELISGTDAIVIGTVKPWLEGMLIANGAEHVTTLEYTSLIFENQLMSPMTPYKYAEDFLSGQHKLFEFAASFSSLEHSGLGRYGDPINPYGDLEAMAQVWCMLKPGAMFFVGVPMGRPCSVQWNAHRRYDDYRLKHMFANWEFIERQYCEDHSRQEVFILRKPLV